MQLLHFFGTGNIVEQSRWHRNQIHGTVNEMRYLGPHLTADGLAKHEVSLRINAAQCCYGHFAKFWPVRCDIQFKQIISRCTIIGTLLSGLDAMVLTPKEETKLDKKLLALARRALAGLATKKTKLEDGTVKTEAVKDQKVRHLMAFAPAHIELRPRRLSMRQRICRLPEHHDQILTAMFGQFSFDDDEHNAETHRGALRLEQDLKALQEFDSTSELGLQLDGTLSKVFHDEELCDLFCRQYLREMRARHCTVAIPPPNWAPVTIPGAVAQDMRPNLRCGLLCSDGTVCMYDTKTLRAMRFHQTLAQAHTLTKPLTYHTFVISNVCPWCARTSKNIEACRTHCYKHSTPRSDKKLNSRVVLPGLVIKYMTQSIINACHVTLIFFLCNNFTLMQNYMALQQEVCVIW